MSTTRGEEGKDTSIAARIFTQALEKWGNWGQIAPGVSNGQSEIKFTKLEFARPASIAAQFDPDEGFTGLIQAVLFEVNDRNLIGYPSATGYRYCCTKELVPKTKCYQDRLIYQARRCMIWDHEDCPLGSSALASTGANTLLEPGRS